MDKQISPAYGRTARQGDADALGANLYSAPDCRAEKVSQNTVRRYLETTLLAGLCLRLVPARIEKSQTLNRK
jgi:hypothetical protein